MTVAVRRTMDDKIAELRRRKAELDQRIGHLETFGDDDHPDETVLLYEATGYVTSDGGAYQQKLLTYVALKKGGKWWVSNGQNTPYTWGELVDLMVDSETVWVAESWESVK